MKKAAKNKTRNPVARYLKKYNKAVEELDDVEFASIEKHRFLKIEDGDYAIIVSTPKISSVPVEKRSLLPIIIGSSLLLVLITYLAVIC